MKREEVYRCYSPNHSRKEYGDCQGCYSSDHSVSVELVRLHIPHICDYEAVNSQENYSDYNTGYEYLQHPENDTGCYRIWNESTDTRHILDFTRQKQPWISRMLAI